MLKTYSLFLIVLLAFACKTSDRSTHNGQDHHKDGPCASQPCDEEGQQELVDLYQEDIPGLMIEKTFTVKAHIVQYKNEPLAISPTTIKKAFKELNASFEGAHISFDLLDDISIYSFPYYLSDIRSDQNTEKELTDQLDQKGIINVYVVRTNNLLSGYTPVLSSGFEDYKRFDLNKVFIAHRAIQQNATVAHEFGHFFNLQHTFGNNPKEASTDEPIDGSNCQTTGDFICDTPADPNGQQDCCDCSYQGTFVETDKNFQPLTNNFMSYYKYCCRTEFTPGQLRAIKMAALKYRNYLK